MTLKQLIDSQEQRLVAKVPHDVLAHKIGCHPSALSHWYSGRRKLSPENADRIARALRVKAVIRAGGIQFEKRGVSADK